jgi:hypothetical protein
LVNIITISKIFLDTNFSVEIERKTISTENIWWKVFLLFISMYYLHHFCLQRTKIYVVNVSHWRIEDYVVLVINVIVSG